MDQTGTRTEAWIDVSPSLRVTAVPPDSPRRIWPADGYHLSQICAGNVGPRAKPGCQAFLSIRPGRPTTGNRCAFRRRRRRRSSWSASRAHRVRRTVCEVSKWAARPIMTNGPTDSGPRRWLSEQPKYGRRKSASLFFFFLRSRKSAIGTVFLVRLGLVSQSHCPSGPYIFSRSTASKAY